MSAFSRLCDIAEERNHRIELVRRGMTLQLRCIDPNGKRVLAEATFDPAKPDAAAHKLAQHLLIDDQIE